jgi:hypothetical protein
MVVNHIVLPLSRPTFPNFRRPHQNCEWTGHILSSLTAGRCGGQSRLLVSKQTPGPDDGHARGQRMGAGLVGGCERLTALAGDSLLPSSPFTVHLFGRLLVHLLRGSCGCCPNSLNSAVLRPHKSENDACLGIASCTADAEQPLVTIAIQCQHSNGADHTGGQTEPF